MNERLPQRDDGRTRIAILRFSARFLQVIVVFLIATILPAWGGAQDVEVLLPEKECQVKYALLYSFSLLTTWPQEAFQPPDTGPLVLGVLGSKPYPEYLARIAEAKKVRNRQILIRHFKTPEEIAGCHLLYITNSVPPEVERAVVQRLGNRPILVVSEHPPELGPSVATIHFVIEQASVKFILNTDAAKAHQLQFDARLLKLAKRTTSDSPR
jgi:hypothetical protein